MYGASRWPDAAKQQQREDDRRFLSELSEKTPAALRELLFDLENRDFGKLPSWKQVAVRRALMLRKGT